MNDLAELGTRLTVFVPKGYRACVSFTPADNSPQESFDSSCSSLPLIVEDTPAPKPIDLGMVQSEPEPARLLKTRRFDFSDDELVVIQTAIQARVPYLHVRDNHFADVQRDKFKYRYQCITKDLDKLGSLE